MSTSVASNHRITFFVANKRESQNCTRNRCIFQDRKSYLKKDPTWLKYKGYQMLNDGMLTNKGRLYIPNCEDLKRFIMDELHKIPYSGHLGYQKMIKATRKLFYWPGQKKGIVNYLYKCLECQ
jgi:hypothetical protein